MQSEHIGELAKALAAAQGEIEGAVKDAENPFFKSSYADLTAVWGACRGALVKQELAVIQVADIAEDGSVSLITTLAHSSGEWISGAYPIRPVKDDPQSMGSATTYARRYSLAALVGVAPKGEDDDGNAASANNNTDAPEREKYETEADAWGGPLKKVAFKDAFTNFTADLRAHTDYDELLGFLADNEELTEQCQRDKPSWWAGSSKSDVVGLEQRIQDKMSELSARADDGRILEAG